MTTPAPALNFTHGQLTDYFAYLNDLRESGVTNMFDAAPYLAEDHGLTVADARKVLGAWTRVFTSDKTPREMADAALSSWTAL